MGGQIEVKGPDLEKEGVLLDSLADGALLACQAHGEALVLARSGKDFFAVGAACTHYGAPLADGAIVDGELRCPWHHACFDLKTGAARGAPALNPIDRWSVIQKDGRAFVGAKQEAPARPAEPHTAPKSIVIVGGGAAGNCAAERLRALGYEGALTMISADDSVPYDRPNLSKDYLAGNAPEEWIPLRSRDFYAEKKIELELGTRVTSIDPRAKTVTLASGKTLSYEKLLLATGASPIRLPLPGADLPHVFTLRSLADSRSLIERAKTSKRAVVIGASFIGLEVAAALRTRGLEVAVVAPEARPLEKVLGQELGDFLRALHEEKGVVFHLGDVPASISESAVTTKNGAVLAAELVVMGVGVRPNVELATIAGASVDNGVLVDAHFETSVPGVYAVGDCARYPDLHGGERIRVEHWVAAQREGQSVAVSLLGQAETFKDVPFFWSQHYDVGINYVGHASHIDAIETRGSAASRDFFAAYRVDGKIRAVATIWRDGASLQAEVALEKNDQAALEALLLSQ